MCASDADDSADSARAEGSEALARMLLANGLGFKV